MTKTEPSGLPSVLSSFSGTAIRVSAFTARRCGRKWGRDGKRYRSV